MAIAIHPWAGILITINLRPADSRLILRKPDRTSRGILMQMAMQMLTCNHGLNRLQFRDPESRI